MTDWRDEVGDPERLVVRWDPDARLFVATGFAYGAAGPAAAEIAPGVRFAVDFADPDQLNEIVVEAPLHGDPRNIDPRAHEVLDGLLGPQVVAALLDRAVRDPARAARISYGRVPTARFLDVSRLALASEIAVDSQSGPVRRAVAAIEAAHVATTSLTDDAFAHARDRALHLADEALAALDPHEFEIDGDATATLRVMRSDIALRHDAASAWPVFRSADRRAEAAYSQISAPMAAPASDMPSVAQLAFRTETEVLITAPHATEETWARVFRRHDNLLLGLAPFRRHGGRLRSLIVIPPGLAEVDVFFDLTEDPATSPSFEVQQLRGAVSLGRSACRAERLGDTIAASDLWRECSRAWAAAGDKTRASAALARADRSFRGPRAGTPRRRSAVQAPLVADYL